MSALLNIINGDLETIINFLKEKNIIVSKPPMCLKCSQLMVWQRREFVKDKYTRRCTKCTTYCSIRNKTILSLFKISIPNFMQIVLHWAIQTRQMDQADFIEVSRPTLISIQQTLRMIAVKSLAIILCWVVMVKLWRLTNRCL